jgi:TFIIF-interacting CTD phosphatase-like protein
MNIVLDLDETLVSVTTSLNTASLTPVDFKFVITGQTYYVRKRPNLDKFLKYIFSKFKTVSVWTAATRPYALQVLAGIMTPLQIKSLSFVKTRDDLKVSSKGTYTKPLHRIFNAHSIIKRHNTIMIDDKRSVMVENLGNAIIVPAWTGDVKDKSLAQLIIVLSGILENQAMLSFDNFSEVIYLKDIVE